MVSFLLLLESMLVSFRALRATAAAQYGDGTVRYVLLNREPTGLLEDPRYHLRAEEAHLVLWQGRVKAQRDSFHRLWEDCMEHRYVVLLSVFGGEAENNVKVRTLCSTSACRCACKQHLRPQKCSAKHGTWV